MKKKIVIFYAWGTTNPGDHALSIGALAWLSSIVPQDDIVIVSRYSSYEISDPTSKIEDCFPGVTVVRAPFRFSRRNALARLMQKAYGLMIAILGALAPRLTLNILTRDPGIEALGNARMVLLNGGNLFYWHEVRRAPARLIAFAFPLVMASKLGIPYGFLPQTSGPFEKGLPSRFIGSLFEGAYFALFRDSDSLQNTQSIADLTHVPHAIVPDLAFHLSRKTSVVHNTSHMEEITPQGFVAVLLRVEPLGPDVSKHKDNPEKTHDRLLDLLPPALAEINKNTGKDIALVIQVEHDRKISLAVKDALLERFGINSVVLSFSDPQDFCTLYNRASIVISMRLHSLIFALSQGTPVIALWRSALGTKIPSMMNDWGFSSYCFELDAATVDLIANSAITLCQERADVSTQVSTRLAQRIAVADEFITPFFN